MAFQLNSVVPWGRNIDEYFSMFNLSDKDKELKIAGLEMALLVLIMKLLGGGLILLLLTQYISSQEMNLDREFQKFAI